MENLNIIMSKEITVVVQGAIDHVNTPKCIESIRRELPHAEIIVSTWCEASVDSLDYDAVVFNDDPGSFQMSKFELNNVKRQIVSTRNGLMRATRKYALKLRADIELTGSGFLYYFDKFEEYDEEWHFLKGRIIIVSMVTRDPQYWESPMCPSDWVSFGLTEDMLKLWDIDLPSVDDQNWFEINTKPFQVQYYYPDLIARFNPEQTIWINFVKKFKTVKTDHMFDVNDCTIIETHKSFANNLIILSTKQFGVRFLKPHRSGSDMWHVMTHRDFLSIYSKYANGHSKQDLIDWERISYLRYFWQSNRRLFIKAKYYSCIFEYFVKEFSFCFRHAYSIISKIYNKFRDTRLGSLVFPKHELWWMFNDEATPMFSIVIPVHSSFDLFAKTIMSVVMQSCKDFEIIVSDDSNSKKNRESIKRLLRDIHNEYGVNLKYVFTRQRLGQSRNTNQGLNHARGNFVRILHADDILSPMVLELEKKFLQNTPDVSVVFHSITNFSDESCLNCLNDCTNIDFFYNDAKFFFLNLLHSGCPIPSSMVFDRNILNEIGKFNPNYVRACDWEFSFRLFKFSLLHNKVICHADSGAIAYRTHEYSNRKKAQTFLINLKEYAYLLRDTIGFMKSSGHFTAEEINTFCENACKYMRERYRSDISERSLLFNLVFAFRIIDVGFRNKVFFKEIQQKNESF